MTKPMRALVVNCSAPHYNLGARKLADWLRSEGHTVVEAGGDPGIFSFGFDLVALSVVFSWHAPIALDVAMRVKANAEVWCGGPGIFALGKPGGWWERETGLSACRSIDQRFDKQRGDYKMTFSARGCDVGCSYCIVPLLEGRTFTLDWEFQPASMLCDNNLSALPDEFQQHILDRYAATGTHLGDCNSGFEARKFTEATYERWRPHYKGAWRFAFDTMEKEPGVRGMFDILKTEPAKRKRAYVLVGNEPFEQCHYRAEQVIALGGEPHCQFVLPLNWLGDPEKLEPKHGWTLQRGRDFCRYYNTRGWRTYPLRDYKPRINEPPPFAGLAGMAAA